MKINRIKNLTSIEGLVYFHHQHTKCFILVMQFQLSNFFFYCMDIIFTDIKTINQKVTFTIIIVNGSSRDQKHIHNIKSIILLVVSNILLLLLTMQEIPHYINYHIYICIYMIFDWCEYLYFKILIKFIGWQWCIALCIHHPKSIVSIMLIHVDSCEVTEWLLKNMF